MEIKEKTMNSYKTGKIEAQNAIENGEIGPVEFAAIKEFKPCDYLGRADSFLVHLYNHGHELGDDVAQKLTHLVGMFGVYWSRHKRQEIGFNEDGYIEGYVEKVRKYLNTTAK
jgi:hypothetical protein